MKTLILSIFIGLACSTGFPENPRWKLDIETPIPAHANLDVRWEDSTRFPRKVWIYRLTPNQFSPEIISNVMTLCSFTEKDKIEQNTNGLVFQSPDGSRKLSISFPSGEIHYKLPEPHYGPTNLAVGVPQMSQLPDLATNVLRRLHIRFGDITGYFGTNKIEFSEPMLVYFVGKTFITNITYRTVYFRKAADGMPIVGNSCSFNVGEHGQISKLSITWPNLKRYKSFPTLKPQAIIQLLRQGRAVQEPVPMNVGYIDWSRVKGVTVKKVEACYFAGDTDWLYPFLWLDTTVDTGNGTAEVAIDCPIIDETKP